MHYVCANIFGAIVLNLRFIINSVLTLQVSTTSLPHDREPCEIKVVSSHTCSLHTCVCAGSRRVRVRLSGLINGRNQFNSWGSPQVPHSGPGLCRTLELLYANWTKSRINSLTHSHLVVLILFYRRQFSKA